MQSLTRPCDVNLMLLQKAKEHKEAEGEGTKPCPVDLLSHMKASLAQPYFSCGHDSLKLYAFFSSNLLPVCGFNCSKQQP